MDTATLMGITFGMTLILGTIMMDSGGMIFIHIPSLMVTVGGAISATLINFPMSNIKMVFGITKQTFVFKLPSKKEVINELVDYSQLVMREGTLALEGKIRDIKYPFMKRGIQLLIDGISPEALEDILVTEIETSQERHSLGKKMYEAIGAYAPAFGMIGTLMGLIMMLQQLNDPSQIGQGMATALITTFYGAVIANLFCLPMAGKLETRDKEETSIREIILEGLKEIQRGDAPYLIKERLKTMLPPRLRKVEEAKLEESDKSLV